MFEIFLFLLGLLVSSHGWQERINGTLCSTAFTDGYNYTQWYDATEIRTVNASGTMMLEFYVQGASDAHVLLTSEKSKIGYEIVLGGGANSFSEIRKVPSIRTTKVSITTVKVIDAFNPVGFWVRVSEQSGLIEVGKEAVNLPFMKWTDPNPIPIKYYSFSAWATFKCKWMFECKPVPTLTEWTDHVTKFLTYMEKLKRDVLKKRGAFQIGGPIGQEQFNVSISFNFKFVHLDVMTSMLTLRGISTFEWTDNSIYWNPNNYKNISKLHLSNYEIWQPELVAQNALNPTESVFSESKISVDNNGKVTWRPKFDIKTNCDIDLKLWPWDKHNCTILLSTWSHKVSNNIFYKFKENNKPACVEVAHSDWRLDSMTSSHVADSTPWDDIMASISNVFNSEEHTQGSLQLVVEISRNTNILVKLFYAPLILISVIWLSSFGVMPNSSSKITTICVSIIVSTLIIVYMTKYVPIFAEISPDLMLGYLKLILLISMDAFISSLLITVHSRNRTCSNGHPPFALTRLLTTPIVTTILILPKLDAARSLVHDRRPDGPQETTTTLWDIVIVAVERIIFIIFFVTTMVVVSSVKFSIRSFF